MAELKDPEDLPALYQAADRTSIRAQDRFLLAFRLRIGGLLAAAVGGVLPLSVGSIEGGGLLALIGFLVALGAETYAAVVRPDRAWYEGRAAAESAKTLAWRYTVRGEAFEGSDADKRLLKELEEILQDLDAIDLAVADGVADQITPKMRDLRELDLATRRDLYLTDRVRNQQAWYSRKAKWNEVRGHRWMMASIVLELLGVLGGAARAFGEVDVDLLGLFAAVAATITAWVQAKQHQTLSTAYAITAQELASVASEAEAVADEATWAKFVGEAEEAMSREHTLWRASRGIRVRSVRPAAP